MTYQQTIQGVPCSSNVPFDQPAPHPSHYHVEVGISLLGILTDDSIVSNTITGAVRKAGGAISNYKQTFDAAHMRYVIDFDATSPPIGVIIIGFLTDILPWLGPIILTAIIGFIATSVTHDVTQPTANAGGGVSFLTIVAVGGLGILGLVLVAPMLQKRETK